MGLFDDMETTVCACCGIKFGMPPSYIAARREDGKSFHCPNGHSLSFGMGENDKLLKENQRMKQNAAFKDDQIKGLKQNLEIEQRTSRAYKGQCTKLKKRAKQGVCPCCNRMFMDMQAHMATKHPTFDPEEPLKLVKDTATQN